MNIRIDNYMNIFLFIISILSIQTFSIDKGHELANGGDAIWCENGKRVELFDYFEWRLQGFQLSLGDASSSLEDKVNLLIDRLEKVDPVKGKKLRINFGTFKEDSLFSDKITLTDTDDLSPDFIPRGCQIKQAAINKTIRNAPEAPIYYFDEKIFKLLGHDDQAGLIFHELLYHLYAQENKYPDHYSTGVRYINSMLAANKFDKMHYKDKLERFKSAKFSLFTYATLNDGPFQIDLTQNIIFNPLDLIQEAYLGKVRQIKIMGQDIAIAEDKVRFSVWNNIAHFTTDNIIDYQSHGIHYLFTGKIDLQYFNGNNWVSSALINKGTPSFQTSEFNLKINQLNNQSIKIDFNWVRPLLTKKEQLVLQKMDFSKLNFDEIKFSSHLILSEQVFNFSQNSALKILKLRFPIIAETGELLFEGEYNLALNKQESLKIKDKLTFDYNVCDPQRYHEYYITSAVAAQDAFLQNDLRSYIKVKTGDLVKFDCFNRVTSVSKY